MKHVLIVLEVLILLQLAAAAESVGEEIRTGALEYTVVDFTETASRREGWKNYRFTIQIRNVSDELVLIKEGSLYALSDGQKFAARGQSYVPGHPTRPPGRSHLTPGKLIQPMGPGLPPGYSVIYQQEIEIPKLAPKVDFYLLTPDGHHLEVTTQKHPAQVEALPKQSKNELSIGDTFKVENRSEVALVGLEYYKETNQFLPDFNDFKLWFTTKNLTMNDIDTSNPLLYCQLFSEDGYTAYTWLEQVTVPPLFEKTQPLHPPLKMVPGKNYSLLVYMLGQGKNSKKPIAYWVYRFKAETKGITEGKTTESREISEADQRATGQPTSTEPKSVEFKSLTDLIKGEKILVGPSKKEVQLVENQPLIEKGIGVIQKIVDHLPQYKHIQSWAFGVIPAKNAFGGLTEFGGTIVVGQEILQNHSLDEIAFVIAHEMAHCVLEHKGKPDLKIDPLSKVILWFPEEKLTREQEFQADEHAVIFMDRACFEMSGAAQYLGSLAGTKDELTGTLPFAEHPPISERVNNVIKVEQGRIGGGTAEVVSSLQLFPKKDLYKVGDIITAEFTIKNKSGGCIHMRVLTVGGRLNGECPNGICPDLESKNGIDLCSGDSYHYIGKLKIGKPGAYHFFITYKTRSGVWDTSVQTAPGITNTIDIRVVSQQNLSCSDSTEYSHVAHRDNAFDLAGLRGYCTWYAAERWLWDGNKELPSKRNANQWIEDAKTKGLHVDLDQPVKKSIVVFGTTQNNYGGHVAYVESVNDKEGFFVISQMNAGARIDPKTLETECFNRITKDNIRIHATKYKGMQILGFIYPTSQSVAGAFATALVIDKSGSMTGEKIKKAKDAAYGYAAASGGENVVSLVGFASSAQSIVEPSQMSQANGQLKQDILNVSAGGSTNIGSGLTIAHKHLSICDSKGKMALLMTDGQHNTGTYKPEVEEFVKSGWPIYTVAFGKDADQDTLRWIAERTNGCFSPADSFNLTSVYHRINVQTHNGSIFRGYSDFIKPGKTLSYSIPVEAGLRKIGFYTNWQGSYMETTITSPAGQVINKHNYSQLGKYNEEPTYTFCGV